MRILHVLDHSLPLHSGYAFRSMNILRVQRKRGWDITVLTSPKHQESWKEGSELLEMLEGFPHYRTAFKSNKRIPLYYEANLVRALGNRLQEVVSQCSPDIIHAHSPALNGIPAIRLCRTRRIPFVYEIRAFWEDAAVDHGTYAEGSLRYRLVRLLETQVCRMATNITVLCEALRDDLINRGIPAGKINVVKNGINIEEFKQCEKDEELLKTYGLNGKKVIGFLGSFYRYEGLDLLIEAFASLAERHEDYMLLIAGGGETEQLIKTKVAEKGLESRVILPGRIPHHRMPGFYSAIDVLAYPRYSMRLTNLVTPLKPLEAMAMGKAVVASNVGGHLELIEDGKTGILFKAGDSMMLSSSLEKLLTDDRLRVSLAEQGRAWAETERPWEKTTAVYEAVYKQCSRKARGLSQVDAPEN